MMKRLPVLALALAFLVPGFAHAEADYPPYEDARSDGAACFTAVAPGTCSATEHADAYEGTLGVDIDVAGPGVVYGTAQPQVWGLVPLLPTGTKVVVTATFRVRSANAYRAGLLATATGNAISNVYANAHLMVRHEDGCDLVGNGCYNPQQCPTCESASAETTIVDVSTNQSSAANKDITVTVTLSHPTGFPHGNLQFIATIYAGASLSMRNAPGEGTAGVAVDAVLTKIVAVIS